jgi:hypothetical protein
VTADFAGQQFYEAIVSWASRCSAVSEWKVMNPILGGTGPDSAVFYLNRPLRDQTVQALLIEIEEKLRGRLEALNPSPFGLARLWDGIYRIDVPSQEIQRDRLKIAKDYGSAGTIISSIVCKVAWLAAKDLYHGSNRDQKQEVARKWGARRTTSKSCSETC